MPRLLLLCAAGLLLAGCTEQQERSSPASALPLEASPVAAGRIDWHAWAYRDSARTLGRPIMVFLYTRRSYWCREMVGRCFEDGELAGEIARGTFPIRVDADRRPDLAERYGMGGWPSVVFLTPEGHRLTGSTYLDPADFRRLLRRVRVYFDNPERWEDLERQRVQLNGWIAREARRRSLRLQPSSDLLHRFVDSLQTAVTLEVDCGSEAFLALLEYGGLTGDTGTQEVAVEALGRLVSSPLRDRDGAFFLAPLVPDAALVDSEKNLALNAGRLAAFARAARQTGDPALRKAAVELGDALLKGFRGPSEALFFAGYTGFSEPATPGAMPPAVLFPGGAMPPRRDPALYAGWNALAVSAFLELYRAVGDDRYPRAARGALEALRNRLMRPDGGLCHASDSPDDAPLLLEDQALVARAALDLFEVERSAGDLRFARDLADLMLGRFSDGPGALRDRDPEPERAFAPAVDRLLPSGNGAAAQVFLRLHALTGHPPYRAAAAGILTALIGPSIDRAASMGALTRGLLAYLHPPEAVE